jgi:CheY-like chemotaxis protein
MNAPTPVRRILLVDDDPAYLETLAALMAQFRKHTWEVLTAGEAGRALTSLRENFINLMVVDARMPVVDGFQLTRLARQNYPHLRIAVLTGFADEATRKAYLENGADLFLEKPRSSQGIQTLLITLDDLMAGTPEYGFRGVLEQVELQDLLQIECSRRNSSRLEVFARGERGEIFICEGAVVHAQSGELTGEPAFQHLLSLKGGELRVRPYLEPPCRSIATSWMSLLMEWAQHHDEAATPTPPPDPVPGLASSPPPSAGDAGTEPAIAPLLSRPLTEAELTPLPERIEEMLVCSAAGDVLYEAGCDRLVGRKRLLDNLARRAARMAALWPLGRLERVEFNTSGHRCVAQVLADVSIFVAARSA